MYSCETFPMCVWSNPRECVLKQAKSPFQKTRNGHPIGQLTLPAIHTLSLVERLAGCCQISKWVFLMMTCDQLYKSTLPFYCMQAVHNSEKSTCPVWLARLLACLSCYMQQAQVTIYNTSVCVVCMAWCGCWPVCLQTFAILTWPA